MKNIVFEYLEDNDYLDTLMRHRPATQPADNININHIGEDMNRSEVHERAPTHQGNIDQKLSHPSAQLSHETPDTNDGEEDQTPVFMDPDALVADFVEVSTTQEDEDVSLSQDHGVLSSGMMYHGDDQRQAQHFGQYGLQNLQYTGKNIAPEHSGRLPGNLYTMKRVLVRRAESFQPRLHEQRVIGDLIIKQRFMEAQKQKMIRSAMGGVPNTTASTNSVKKVFIQRVAPTRPQNSYRATPSPDIREEDQRHHLAQVGDQYEHSMHDDHEPECSINAEYPVDSKVESFAGRYIERERIRPEQNIEWQALLRRVSRHGYASNQDQNQIYYVNPALFHVGPDLRFPKPPGYYKLREERRRAAERKEKSNHVKKPPRDYINSRDRLDADICNFGSAPAPNSKPVDLPTGKGVLVGRLSRDNNHGYSNRKRAYDHLYQYVEIDGSKISVPQLRYPLNIVPSVKYS